MKSSAWRGLAAEDPARGEILILGVPFDGAVSASRGAAFAPDRLRELSRILPPFTEEGISLESISVGDLGNVPVSLDWEDTFSRVEQEAAGALETGRFCLFLGGDHSVSIPLICAFSRRFADAPIGVVHLDAHCDLMDRYDGHRWSHACTQRRSLELPNMAPERLALVGIRSYEAGELAFLQDHSAITIIGARQLYREGLAAALEKVCRSLSGAAAVYLSLDIDVLDPAFAPGTGTPEGGGLSTRELLELVRGIFRHLPVRAADLVEISPPLDPSGITAWAALKVIYEIFAFVKS